MTAFILDAAERVSADTQKFYRRFLEPFAARFGPRAAPSITTKETEAFARRPTWSSSTRHDCIGTIATAFKWGGYALAGLRRPPKTSRGPTAIILPRDFGRLIHATSGDFQALLRFLWHTGCRPSEASGIDADAVDLRAGVVLLTQHKTAGKTGKPRVIYLSAAALDVLRGQLNHYPAGLLFRNARGGRFSRNAIVNRMWRLQRELGIAATAYGFRHSFITDSLSAGTPEPVVAALVGHVGTAMLANYNHVGARGRLLREAAEKIERSR
jgi:integrase